MFGMFRAFFHCFQHEYVLTWPVIALPRGAALKQCTSKSLYDCVRRIGLFAFPFALFLWYFNSKLSIYFELMFILLLTDFLWTLGKGIMALVFTERLSFPRIYDTDCFVDYRELALEKRGLLKKDYFEYLAYHDLEWNANADAKNRQVIYREQWSFLSNIINRKIQSLIADLDALFQQLETNKVREEDVFQQKRLYTWLFRAYSFLIAKSVKEDQKGVVQRTVNCNVQKLLELLLKLEAWAAHHKCTSSKQSVLEMIFILEESIQRIMIQFHIYLNEFTLPQQHMNRLNLLLHSTQSF